MKDFLSSCEYCTGVGGCYRIHTQDIVAMPTKEDICVLKLLVSLSVHVSSE